MSDEPQARVEVGPDGQLILIDPVAAAVMAACGAQDPLRVILEDSRERVNHFVLRAVVREVFDEACVVVLDVDDPDGAALTEKLMPNQFALWESFRAKGQKPIARGLALIEGLPREPGKIPVLVITDGRLLIEHWSPT